MATTSEETTKLFGFTERIGNVLYLTKTVLRHSYLMKKEFTKMNPDIRDTVDHPSLVPMDLSVRSIATVDNVEDHLKQLHVALRHCLGIFICYMEMDEKVRGKKTDSLATNAKIVRAQLEQLIHDTKDLMTGNGPHLDTTPHRHAECTPENYTEAKSFEFLVFAHRLLDEIPLWAQLLLRNLLVYRQKKEEEELQKIQQ